MPVLKQHADGDTFFVLTRVGKSVATLQITPEGIARLRAAKYGPDDVFPRALLGHLWQEGHVFTSGGVTEACGPHPDQLAFDFFEDDLAEDVFPRCATCDSLDAAAVCIPRTEPRQARIACGACRSGLDIDIAVPLDLLSRSRLSQLVALSSGVTTHESVHRLQQLYETDFERSWEAHRKQPPGQDALFVEPDLFHR